ncbi:MAG: hypothetical protein GX058_00345 [Firmicutes bacterium]|nr:hypothetical protein [Bacillota bacterium]
MRNPKTTFLFASLLVLACSVTGLAADDSACITCHTNYSLLDNMVPVITKVSTGG